MSINVSGGEHTMNNVVRLSEDRSGIIHGSIFRARIVRERPQKNAAEMHTLAVRTEHFAHRPSRCTAESVFAAERISTNFWRSIIARAAADNTAGEEDMPHAHGDFSDFCLKDGGDVSEFCVTTAILLSDSMGHVLIKGGNKCNFVS
jgi:hypothetical protein